MDGESDAVTTDEILARIDAKRSEQRRLVKGAQSAETESQIRQLDFEIHDLKAELYRLVAAGRECLANGV